MAQSNHPSQRFIEASLLDDWVEIDSGGFGEVFRARHREWCSDVAIKLLRVNDTKALLREIKMMRQGSSPHVIHVHGIFRGHVPFRQCSIQLGLVMEFMERGSLSYLQKTLDEPPPWPLVTRLAHQVALGINFLHSLKPPVLHLDLKPSNVLLDPALNAKLTDFGLSRFYHSHTQLSKQDTVEEGGTLPYMPPEALADVSYKPTQATDIYSYSILLWSIVTGKTPYENKIPFIITNLVPQGQRPSLDEFMLRGSGRAGLEQLEDLMQKCWAGDRKQRPSSHECTTVTEKLFKMHKHAIDDVVHQVQKKLDLQKTSRPVTNTEASVSVRTGPPPVQEVPISLSANHTQGYTGYKGSPSYQRANTCEVDTGRSWMDHKVKGSSVHPILSSKLSHSTTHRACSSAGKMFSQFLRQWSNPCLFSYYPPPPPEHSINMNNVTGIQYGNNNIMHVYNAASQERRRHPTAPPSVNFPPAQSGSR